MDSTVRDWLGRPEGLGANRPNFCDFAPALQFMSALETMRSKLRRDITASTDADLARVGHIRKTTYAFIFLTAAKESSRAACIIFLAAAKEDQPRAVIEGGES